MDVPAGYGTTTGRVIALVRTSADIPLENNRGKYPLIEYAVNGATYRQMYTFTGVSAGSEMLTVRYDTTDPSKKIIVTELQASQKQLFYIVAFVGIITLAISISLFIVKRNKGAKKA